MIQINDKLYTSLLNFIFQIINTKAAYGDNDNY